MNILVTGATGYLGNSFINKYKNIYNFKKFSLLSQKLDSLILNEIDSIVHCAALVHQKIEYSYEQYKEINLNYPLKLAQLAKENGVKQFVFISTVAVYAESNSSLNENTACRPVTFYGKSKLEAEEELIKLSDKNFTVSIVRAPMIYGNNAPGNINTLLQLIKKSPIIPLGSIDNKRSFIYIGNLCHLINEVIKQKQNGIFLAADDKAISTSRLIELLSENLNKKVHLLKIPFFETLLRYIKPSYYERLYGSLEIDNKLTKEKLNLKNPYSIEYGIKLMIKGEK